MKVLLTGANGFLGRAVLGRVGDRHEVTALYRGRPGDHSGVRWVAQDLAEPLSRDLPERVDAVVHLAQSMLYRDFPNSAVDVFEVNVGATLRLLDFCRRAGGTRFVLASSGAVYAPGEDPVREEDDLAPPDFYAESKVLGERLAARYREQFGVHVFRPFFIYGPGQQADRFLPGLAGRVTRGEPVRLNGPEGIRVNPVFIDDAADQVLAALDLAGSETLNMAGPTTWSIRQITDEIGRQLGHAPVYQEAEPRGDLVASLDRLSELLGMPPTSLEKGIPRAVGSLTSS